MGRPTGAYFAAGAPPAAYSSTLMTRLITKSTNAASTAPRSGSPAAERPRRRGPAHRSVRLPIEAGADAAPAAFASILMTRLITKSTTAASSTAPRTSGSPAAERTRRRGPAHRSARLPIEAGADAASAAFVSTLMARLITKSTNAGRPRAWTWPRSAAAAATVVRRSR